MSTGGPPGSLSCLLEGVGSLFRAIDDLTYQLELSDSFDSGNGTEEEEEVDTEAESTYREPAEFAVCKECQRITAQVRGKYNNERIVQGNILLLMKQLLILHFYQGHTFT